MKEFFSHILDLLFPKKPEVTALEGLARNGKLNSLPPPPVAPDEWIHPLFHYRDPQVRTLVWQIKYVKNELLIKSVAEILSEEILAHFSDEDMFASGSWLLIPIPASKAHAKKKGFNQTEELCQAIMETDAEASLTYMPILEKIRETKPQTEMKSRSERLKNLTDTFAVRSKENISGKHAILIDDVTTTGSTLVEARRALRSAGIKRVIGFTIAH